MDGRIMHETRAGLGFVGRVRAPALIVSHSSRRLFSFAKFLLENDRLE
jgi:hypothetical protein